MKKLVKILWIDANDLDRTWANDKDIEKYLKEKVLIESYGFIIKKNKDYIVLAADHELDDEDKGDWGRVTKIPIKWIKKISSLQEGGKK